MSHVGQDVETDCRNHWDRQAQASDSLDQMAPPLIVLGNH